MNLKSVALVEFEECIGDAASRFHAPRRNKRLMVLRHKLARPGETHSVASRNGKAT